MAEHTHDFPAWPFGDAIDTTAYCTTHVAQRRLPALQVAHDVDGDWQFLDASTDDPGEAVLLCMGCVIEHDTTLAQLSDLPCGWSAFRNEVGASWERWRNKPEPEHVCNTAAGEEKAMADIEKFGLHIISVMEEGGLPPFSYSIGIGQSLGLPELIVVGLKNSVAHYAINACYDQMKAGTVMAPGVFITGLLGGGFSCAIGAVDPSHFKEYMGWALWLYEGANFRALQIIFPSTANVFPWEPAASVSFRDRQPLLAAARVN
jgi:hypothetical protein